MVPSGKVISDTDIGGGLIRQRKIYYIAFSPLSLRVVAEKSIGDVHFEKTEEQNGCLKRILYLRGRIFHSEYFHSRSVSPVDPRSTGGGGTGVFNASSSQQKHTSETERSGRLKVMFLNWTWCSQSVWRNTVVSENICCIQMYNN